MQGRRTKSADYKVIDCLVLLLAFALLSSCAKDSSVLDSARIGADEALHVDSDGYLRNRKDGEVLLRGVNLGGWMLQESWMCPVYGQDREWANLDTYRAMENRGWSAAQIQELFDAYQDNWITVDDFDILKERNVNSLRLPFWYRNFMSDEAGTWIGNDDGSAADTKNPGFLRLDWAIAQAKERGMYVILDLHGAVGGQSTDHSTGTLGKNGLFANPVYEEATVALWKAIAARYKDEPAVAAYDLLNEPQNNDGNGDSSWRAGTGRAVHETVRIYDRLYREIRDVDPETIIIMEGIWEMNLPDPMFVYAGELDAGVQFSGKKTAWDKNVMYSMHLYDRDRRMINYRVNELIGARRKWGVAVHVGEFNNGDEFQAYAYKAYNDNRISWNMWTYKIAGANMGNWSLFQAARKSRANPNTDSFETVKEKWGETLRTFNPGTSDLANGFTRTAGGGANLEGQTQEISGLPGVR